MVNIDMTNFRYMECILNTFHLHELRSRNQDHEDLYFLCYMLNFAVGVIAQIFQDDEYMNDDAFS